jgi:hypothetical protein
MAAAEIVKVDVAALDPGAIVAGDEEHVTPAGTCEHDSEIGLLSPPTALAPTVIVVDWPGVRVALCAESVSEKSAVVTAAAGTRIANKPEVWLLPPAVK